VSRRNDASKLSNANYLMHYGQFMFWATPVKFRIQASARACGFSCPVATNGEVDFDGELATIIGMALLLCESDGIGDSVIVHKNYIKLFIFMQINNNDLKIERRAPS